MELRDEYELVCIELNQYLLQVIMKKFIVRN